MSVWSHFRLVLRATTTLALALVALAGCHDATGPAVRGRPADAELLVGTNVNGLTTIGRMRTDGSAYTEILDEMADGMDLAWAPDYRRFAFSRGSTISTIGVDGSDRRIVLNIAWGRIVGIGWSPDGRRLVFGACAVNYGSECGIHTVSIDDGSIDTLYTAAMGGAFSPAWSPDGRWIAFTHYIRKDSSTFNFAGGLFVMRADGSGLREIARAPSDLGTPSWSPDGRSIAFASDAAGPTDIWIVQRDGTGARRLTNAFGFSDGSPEWSPDGKRIAFQRSSRLMMVHSDGGEPQPVPAPQFLSTIAW